MEFANRGYNQGELAGQRSRREGDAVWEKLKARKEAAQNVETVDEGELKIENEANIAEQRVKEWRALLIKMRLMSADGIMSTKDVDAARALGLEDEWQHEVREAQKSRTPEELEEDYAVIEQSIREKAA